MIKKHLVKLRPGVSLYIRLEASLVASIEAMKMESLITSPITGRVERILLDSTRQVENGDLLLTIA
ncbi:biotin/lipoyl-containing protein [Microbacterium sp. X-17]|uniref:biotin/lipoyl-containing protein n=1 Tax=Microbacterium sp. X-17 TaxID=3144404 RepID=UPI0031F52145